MSDPKSPMGRGPYLAGEQETLVGRVTRAMREEIVGGALPADAHLYIDALAQRFGTSAIPIREALRNLATEGLVTPEANKGFRVRAATVADLEETYKLRMLLDPLAVWYAVPRMTEANIGELATILEDMRAAEVADDARAYWRTHIDFHFGIYRHCGQSWLLRFINSLYANSDRYRPGSESHVSSRYAEHLQVLRACEDRDRVAAARQMEEHLHQTYLMRVAAFEGASPDPEPWLSIDWP